MEGTCNCGAIRVKIDDDELFTKRRGHICHCENCRKTASSAYGANLMIETSKVTITGADNLTLFEDPKSLSGNVVKRYFCKTCGNPIKSETVPATQQGKVILKLGIFPRIPQPEMEAFVDTKLPWLAHHEGTTLFKTKVGGDKAERTA